MDKGNAAGSGDDPGMPLGSGESGRGQRVGINSGAVPPFGQATWPWSGTPGTSDSALVKIQSFKIIN